MKHCCYGDCNSDSRYVGRREDMEGVCFIPFPKPKTQLEKCERWVRLCGRKFFTVENIRKETYICSKHFVGGKGPTKEHPDPLPALATSFERNRLLSKRKRKSPLKRPNIHKPSKRKRLAFDLGEDTENSMDSENDLPSYSIHTDHCYFVQNSYSEQTSLSAVQLPDMSTEDNKQSSDDENAFEVFDNKQSSDDENVSEVFEATLGLYQLYR